MDRASTLAIDDTLTVTAQQLRSLVDGRLGALLPGVDVQPHLLHRAMRHLVLAPGKRLRPLLTAMCAIELGGDELTVLDVACAIEMVHAASLILDDLPCMDDATLRRGVATTHIEFGEDVALLASIALLGRAFEVVAQQRQLDARHRADVTRLIAGCIGSQGLTGGQFDDLRADRVRCDALAIEQRNFCKTGTLFVVAVEAAASIRMAADHEVARLRDFATRLGAAFQICDDILDATRPASAAGKDTGKDAGKSTVVALLGVHGARRAMHEHLRQAHRLAQSIADERDAAGSGALVEFLHLAFGSEMQAILEP